MTTTRPPHVVQCSRNDAASCCDNCWELYHSPGRNGKHADTIGEIVNSHARLLGSDSREHVGSVLERLISRLYKDAKILDVAKITAMVRHRYLAIHCPDVLIDNNLPGFCVLAVNELIRKNDQRCRCGSGFAADACPTCHPAAIEKFTIGELQDQYPRLNPPRIDGLLRKGEIGNINSYSKIGKSWLMYSLLLSFATGRPWLDRFIVSTGRVLLIDNELHRPTIASRVRTVAEAMGIIPAEYRDAIEVWPLRGRLRNIFAIGPELEKATGFEAIILDAKYRMQPSGVSENDNAGETEFYNVLDRYAEANGAAIICVHHASKGNQSDKRVTDVGAGAGAQSRAADCHVVLREHEDDGVCVMEAAIHSFAPLQPFSLRWEFPLWRPDDESDPTKLRGRMSAQEQRQKERDADGTGKVIDQLMLGPKTISKLRTLTGLSKERVERIIGIMQSEGRLDSTEVLVKGNATMEYRIKCK